MPEHQQYIKTLAIAGSGILLAGLLGKVLGMLNTFALAYLLGPEQLGVFVLAFSVVQILSVLCPLGYPVALTRAIAHYDSLHDYSHLKGVLSMAILLTMIIAVAASGVLHLCAGFFSRVFHTERLTLLLPVLAWSLPFFVLFSLLLAAIQGLRFPALAAWIRATVEPSLRLILFLLLAIGGFRLFGAVFSVFSSMLLGCICALVVFLKKSHWHQHTVQPRYAWTDLSFSLELFLISAISLATQWTDSLFIGYFLTTRDVGLYDVAFRVAGLTTLFYVAANAAISPLFAELFALGRIQGIEAVYKVNTRWVVMLTLPIFLIVLLLSPEILSFFGQDFVDASGCLLILATGIFLSLLTGPSWELLLMGGRSRLCFLIAAVSGGMNFLLNLILIPRYGITGAAMATASTYLLTNYLNLAAVIKWYRIHPYDPALTKPFLAGLVALGTVMLMTMGTAGLSSLLRALLGSIILLGLYVATLAALGWEDGDREVIKSLGVHR